MWSTLCSTEPLLRPLLLAPVCNKKTNKKKQKTKETLTKKKEKKNVHNTQNIVSFKIWKHIH